jgi:hypothetical protein
MDKPEMISNFAKQVDGKAKKKWYPPKISSLTVQLRETASKCLGDNSMHINMS